APTASWPAPTARSSAATGPGRRLPKRRSVREPASRSCTAMPPRCSPASEQSRSERTPPPDPPGWRLMMRPLLSVTVLVLLISADSAVPAAAPPDGQVTWGVHIYPAPSLVDRAETSWHNPPVIGVY